MADNAQQTDWLAEAERILALPMPQSITETDLRMRQLTIILSEIVRQGK